MSPQTKNWKRPKSSSERSEKRKRANSKADSRDRMRMKNQGHRTLKRTEQLKLAEED